MRVKQYRINSSSDMLSTDVSGISSSDLESSTEGKL